jgi:hypothetical protein
VTDGVAQVVPELDGGAELADTRFAGHPIEVMERLYKITKGAGWQMFRSGHR